MQPRVGECCRFGAWLVLALLPTLPGCLTYAMWGYDYLSEQSLSEQPATVQLVRSEVHDQHVEIVRTAAVTVHGAPTLELRGAEGQPGWRLRPVRGCEAAMHLVQAGDVLRPSHAMVTAVRELHDAQVVRADAELVLVGAADDAAIGEEIAPTTLSPQALAVLAGSRRQVFAFAADAWAGLPPVLRDCRDGLSAELLAKLLAARVPAPDLVVESFAFVGDDGLPRFEPGMPLPDAARSDDPSLAERLDLLSSVALVLRLGPAENERHVRLRPDRLWLRTVCDPCEAGLRHRSVWQLEAATVPPAAAGESGIPCQLLRTDAVYAVLPMAPADVLVRAALTPLTLVADFTLLLPFTVLGARLKHWLEDDDGPARLRHR